MSRGPTIDAALNWWTFLLIFLLARDVAPDRFLRFSAIGASALALLSLIAKLTAHGRIFWLFPSGYTADVFGPFVSRNQFAAWIELSSPSPYTLRRSPAGICI